MYVCFILFGVLLSSLLISGCMMKYLVEKPIQKTEVLNFDYTKQNLVAYVPITSCAGIVCGGDCENNIGVNNMIDAWVIPPKQKVQVTVSLLVPESEYNRNLGVFQVPTRKNLAFHKLFFQFHIIRHHDVLLLLCLPLM